MSTTAQVIKVSNSMLVSVANCSTQAMIKTAGWSLSLSDKEITKETPMRAGSSAHVALEWWLSGATPDTCEEAFRTDYEPFSNLHVAPNKPHHVDNLARIVRHFVETHPLDEQPFEVICTEREIEATLLPASEAGPEVRLVVRADGLVADKQSGALQPMEHKTHGKKIYPEWKKAFNMDSQIMTHLFGWRSEGYSVASVLMNVIPFVRLPPSRFTTSKKTGETKESHCRTEGHEGFVPSRCWTLHCQGEMFLAKPSEYVYENWLAETKKNAAKYRRLLMQSADAPIAMDGLKRGYCGRCDFQDFCYSGRSNYGELTKRDAPVWITRSGLYNE